MAFSLFRMMQQAGVRRRRVRLRPVRAKPALVRELEPINAAIMDPWEAGIEAIVAAYRLPGKTGFNDSVDDTGRLIDLIVLETNQTLIRLTGRIRAWGAKAERIHRAAWTQTVLIASSIDLSTVLSAFDVSETVDAAIARNVSLVKGVSEATRSRMSDIIFRGIQQRTPARKIATLLRLAVDLERKRALRIAADQTTKIYSTLNRARQQQAGLDHYIWRHSGKKFPRKDHLARDGVLYKWDASTAGPGRAPVPDDDEPGMKPFCGCVAQAVILDETGKPL